MKRGRGDEQDHPGWYFRSPGSDRLRDQQFCTRSLIESNIDAIITTDQRGVPGAEPGAGPQNRALWLDRLVAMATFKM